MFTNKFFYLYNNDKSDSGSSSSDNSTELSLLIVRNGGVMVPHLNEQAVQLTHCVVEGDVTPSSSMKPLQLLSLQQISDLKFVREEWVRESVKTGTILPESEFSPAENSLPRLPLAGKVVCVSALKSPQIEQAIALLRYLGSGFSETLHPDCTHLILAPEKPDIIFPNFVTNMKVVSSDWLNVCATQSKCVDEEQYAVKVDIEQPVAPTTPVTSIVPDFVKVTTTQQDHHSQSQNETTSEESKIRQIFKQFTFLLIARQYVNPSISKEVLRTLLGCSAGILNSYNSGCTHVICRYLSDKVCEQALKDGKQLVTVQWLDDCIRRRSLIDADASLIYRPIKDNKGITDLKDWIISISGFVGSERNDIIYLIRSAGASFSGDFSVGHSCLVLAPNPKVKSKKEELALSEHIPIVTKEWVFQCVREWKLVDVKKYLVQADQKYKIRTKMHMYEDGEEDEAEEINVEPPAKRQKVVVPPMNSNNYVFLLSNEIAPTVMDLEELKRKLRGLGARVLEAKDTGRFSCTHLVIKDLKRTEKLLCACAAGAWVVRPEFIHKSIAAGGFVEETPYEIDEFVPKTATTKPVPNPAEWRRHIQKTKKGPFHAEVVLIAQTDDQPPVGVLESILHAGGVKKVITKQFAKKLKTAELTDQELGEITFAIVNHQGKPDNRFSSHKLIMKQLVNREIPKVRGSYILDRMTSPTSTEMKDYMV